MDDVNISIKDVGGNVEILAQLAADETQKILGVWLAPDGNNRKQIEEMRTVIEKWVDQIRVGALDNSDVWQALTNNYEEIGVPSIRTITNKKQMQLYHGPSLKIRAIKGRYL